MLLVLLNAPTIRRPINYVCMLNDVIDSVLNGHAVLSSLIKEQAHFMAWTGFYFAILASANDCDVRKWNGSRTSSSDDELEGNLQK